MAGKTLIYQFLSTGTKNITVPSGYGTTVLAYVWGAGGGNGSGAAGSPGGFVAGVIDVSKDSVLTVSVGGPGGSTTGYRPAGSGGSGSNPYANLSGGRGGLGNDEDGDSGSGGGGGAASGIFVDGVPVIVAAGGGGGGGYGDDGAGGATVGTPGGVATRTNSLPRGADGKDSGSGSGGGGGGYPYGGATGTAYGDDARGSDGGFGGQNYANLSIVSSSIIENGSSSTPGGLRLSGNPNPYYPKRKIGYTGYSGAVILVFVKGFQGWIKDSDEWKQITQAWIKTPETILYRDVSPGVQTVNLTSAGSGSWTVPTGITSINVTLSGGGGGGASGGSKDDDVNYYGGGGGGGGSGYTTNSTLSVTPGSVINYSVGRGGAGGVYAYRHEGPGYPGTAGGTTTFGALTVAGGNGGSAGGGGDDDRGPGAGGAGGTGYISGTNGTSGGTTTSASIGGDGGRSIFGGGGSGGRGVGSVGQNAPAFGAGGGGGASGANGGSGRNGAVRIEYTPPSYVARIITGGWKEVERAWIKDNGTWKPIETPVDIIPIASGDTPSTYQVLNLVIASDTQNYELADYLSPAAGYFPGLTVINITVDAGVTVSSTSPGAPAIVIDGLTDGDVVNLINNGYITGMGGFGATGGE